MKKLNAIVLIFVLVLILPACHNSSPTKAVAVEKTQVSETAVTSNYIWPIKNKIYPSREDFVAGDDTAGFISARFRGNSKTHSGIDLAFKDGTPVYAAASGTVVFTGCGVSECGEACDDKCAKGYGKDIIISHPDGVMTVYAHLQEFKISKGESVKQGDLIGLVGHTVSATGSVLHFEIRKNAISVDPMLYLPKLEEKDAIKKSPETTFVWPIKNKIYPSREDVVAGDDTAGFISSRFDNNKNHRGIDLAFKDRTPVYSAASGTVVFAGCGVSECGEECEDKCNKKYGKYIIISHPDGMVTVYAHLQEFKISKGESVKQGDLIGLVGHTGFVTGPHLHFEIRKDAIPVDPMLYLPKIQ